jgi:hypothetical protein
MPCLARNLKFRPFSVLFSILPFLALTLPATARTVTVECGEGSVSNVLKNMDPQASNTIRVIGTCQDYVGISDFTDLTIVGVSSGGKSDTIQSLNGSPIFWIVASHVQIKNLTISGGVYPVMCREFSVCRFSGNTIQNSNGNGVNIDSADATFSGDVIQNNANSGLNLTAARVRLSQVTVQGTTSGPWGPGTGLDINSGSTVTVEQLNVTGNQGAGLSVTGNSHLTNRPWTGAFTVSNNANGGIWVVEQSSADLSGATVTGNAGGNGGAGVVIDGNAYAAFWGGGTFTNNQPMDVYCGANFAFAAAPQQATIGNTNCPNTY